jgi:cysteine synthase B
MDNLNNTLLGQIGNTPLLEIMRLAENTNVKIFAKAEWFNPGGSIKDRPAFRMISEGIKAGKLTKEKTIIDSTSGNTGIAYAMIGKILGFKVELIMPRNVSSERIRMVRAFGAKITFTDPIFGSDGAIKEANRIYGASKEQYFMPDQYSNPANPLAHFETTGPEIISQTQGKITHFIAGTGTSGTLMGTGRALKKFNKDIKVLSFEPKESLHGIEGLKHLATSIVPEIYDDSLLDDKIFVSTEDAYQTARKLVELEGLFVGYSSGAAMFACLELSKKIKEGIIVTVFPDSGERYLSTSLWE